MPSIEERNVGDGKKVYRVKVRLKGHPVQTATFERKTDARRWAQQTESAIREGRHFKTTEAKRRTLGEMVDRYLLEVLPNKSESMQRDQDTQLTWWKEKLGSNALADITPAAISEHRELLGREIGPKKKKRSNATVNRYLSALSHALTIAVREWEWLDDSPMRRVSKKKEPRGRVRFLSDEERENLLKACKKSDSRFLFPVVIIGLSTGARRMEILSLQWADVDLNRGLAFLHDTKNQERRALPLAHHALGCLKDLSKVRRLDTNLVFPNEQGNNPFDLKPFWEKAIKAAKIQDFRFHDLRHSAASYLAMSGATLAEIAEVLGHKTLAMVKRYSHLSEAHTAGVVEKMNKKFFGDG